MKKARKMLLIVDDEALNRKLLRKCLQDSYEIQEAANGQEALALLDKYPDVCAVLLDKVMPVMDGINFLEELKKHPSASVPVIVMTANNSEESELRALDHGAVDFVPKPYNPKVLLSRVNNAIARSQLEMLEQLRYLSEHDPLTGLYKRGRMFRETEELLRRDKDTQFVFLRIDIDRFRLFNAAFGEAEGDRLILYAARLVEDAVQAIAPCVYGRMNADVFCVCAPYVPQTLETLVEKANEALGQYRKDYLLTLSAGAYIITERELSAEEMYIRASTAARRCKAYAARTLAFYDADEAARAQQEVDIANDIHVALKEKQFCVYVQPKFDLSTEGACGGEALVRWKHPTKGMISPGEFIPVCEKNGFIAQIDLYMWEEVCALLQRWCREGKRPDPISVNVSRISLYNPHLVELLDGLVKKYELEPRLLQLEITESAYMSNPDLMRDTIRSLREAGFVILIDDFGSGYSSLNTLKDIDVDVLKIDMNFLPKNSDVQKAEIILASVARMASWLGMAVVVEGVETRRQRDFLEGIGSDYVQGFYYARPMSAENYERDYVNRKHLQEERAPGTQPQPMTPCRGTLVIVDDDPLTCEVLRNWFDNDYQIEACNSAEEALTYLRRHSSHVRLIFIDNFMSGMTGLDFLEYCRTEPVFAAIPKILITGEENTKEQITALRLGAFDYITKPFVREVVQARANHVLALSEQIRYNKEVEARARSLMQRDESSGLLTKTAFRDICGRILSARDDALHALLILDIDDFKLVNDSHGHLVGDAVIRCIAGELKAAFRKGDVIGRFGGDEFMVLMVDMNNVEYAKSKAAALIKAILFACTQKLHLDTGVSIGIAASEPGDTFDTLFSRADQALYEVKKGGKGHTWLYGEHVPPIVDDAKPIVLVCGQDPEVFSAIALSYGETAAFACVRTEEDLHAAFKLYAPRIRVVCLSMTDGEEPQAFYQLLRQYGGGKTLPLLAICPEGDMEKARQALSMDIIDILNLPVQMETVRRRISKCLLDGETGSTGQPEGQQ